MSCERCFIFGRVQGVFFRASTQIKAHDLGVTGYAHNLSDGRVEVLACGDEKKIKELKDWLWEGPVYAEVDNIECNIVDEEGPVNFTTN